MPLLRKQLFERQKPPHDLQPDEEVFFCKLTKEVFRDYDAFFERIILCNSLVWSCSLTGHPNLTYQEALDSEAKARKALENFPRELVRPILYLVTLTRRGKQPDVMDDVFVYARDRFFIGETVEAVIDSTWCDAKVMKVIPPTEREIAAYKSASQSPSPSKSTVMNLGRKKFWPPPQLYKYELEEVEPEDTDMIQIHVVDAEEIRRERGLYTREKSQLFLRQCLELGPDLFCRLKERALRKYRIHEVKFEDIFAGPLPNFEETPSNQKPALKMQKINQMPLTAKKTLSPKQKQKDEKKRVRNEKEERSPSKEKQKQAKVKENKDQKDKKKKKDKKETKKQSTLDQWVKTDGKKAKEKSKDKNQEKEVQKKKNNGHHEEKKKKKLTAEEIEQEMLRIREQRERFKEDMKRRAEELKQKRLEERARERAKMKEEKKLLNEYMQEWSRARDDLECDDLKELPHPSPVQCCIPNHLFGDFLMILEFFHCFGDLVEVKDSFGQRGVTFDILEQALVENEMTGPLNDILQLLLKTIFDLQEEEEEEVNDTQNQAKADLDIDEVGSDMTVAQAIKSATAAASWSQTYQGNPLRKLVLDSMTLSEILRLHLLASGGYCGEKNAKWRHQQRGGYTGRDDPGLHFRLEEPQILRQLSVGVHVLPIGAKLKIMACLMNQILSYVAIRDVIDDNTENLRLTKYELKLHQCAEQRREREEAAVRFRKKMEEKRKQKEEIQRKKEQQLKADENKEFSQQLEVEKNEEKDSKGKQKKEEKNKEEFEENLTERQREAIIAKKEKEEATRKKEYVRKEAELIENIQKYQSTVAVQPLGRDRAYRRFWIFHSLPGLFVEHDDDFLGPCLPSPTPAFNPATGPPTSEQGLKYIKQILKDKKASQSLEEKNSSDKENDSVDGDRKKPEVIRTYSNKKLLGDKNVSAVLSSVVKNTENKVSVSNVENKLACSVASTKVELMDIQEEVAKIQSATAARDAELKQKEKEQELTIEIEQRDDKMVAEKPPMFGTCVADIDNCTVHSVILPKTKWAFFSKAEEYERLVQCLNPRGFRESELKQSLIQEKELILESMAKCPVHKIDQSQEPVEDLEAHRRITRLQGPKKEVENINFNFPPGTPTSDVMELTLRDIILEFEEKVHFGALGSLKVANREKWREAIINRTYDMQCDKLVWGGETRAGDHSGLTTPEKEVKKEDKGKVDDSPDTEDLDINEIRFNSENLNVPVKTKEEEEEEEEENEPLADQFHISSAVKDLASAILQLGQCIEVKYLKKPLGEDEKEKKRRERAEERLKKEREEEHEDDEDDEGDEETEEKDRIIRTPLERWEMSLMSSTSFSQLFVHFYTLENSVAWSRSALNASCRFCHRKSDPENMLLCDGCDKGQHIYCLKPKLKSIPEGEWFCTICKPKEKPRTPRKTRRLFSEESEDEEAEGEEEEEEYESSSEEEEEEDSDAGSEHHDECDVCGKGGHVICCDTCPLVFHLNCIVPPLNKVPRGKWSCPQCKPPVAAPVKRSRETDKKSKARHLLDFSETKKDRKGCGKNSVDTRNSSQPQNNRQSLEASPTTRHSLETGRNTARSSSGSSRQKQSMDSSSGGKRRSASEAVEKIFISLKRLRRNDSFEDSEESWSSSTRGSKRTSSGRRGMESDGDFDVAVLEDLLLDLTKHSDGWPFLRPVSKADAPDYHDIIKRPMDFATMRHKLNSMKYSSSSEFLADALLVFENCQMYNRADTDEYKAGQRLSKYFDNRTKDLGLIINPDSLAQRDAKKKRLN